MLKLQFFFKQMWRDLNEGGNRPKKKSCGGGGGGYQLAYVVER
jgi:hypothetical protein